MKVALGIGCDRGTPVDTLRAAVDEALHEASATWADVVAVGSITLKSDEAGLLELAAEQGWELTFHPPEVLAEVPVPNPSETVRRYTGTPSVSEAAALLGAGPRATMDVLMVEKLRLRGPDGRNATVSVARRDDSGVEASLDGEHFSSSERDVLQRVMAARRDVRHFRAGATVPDDVRARLLQAIDTAPSVGLMQPWRFLRITAPERREALAELVDAERLRTAEALGERGAEFLALKVEGVRECAELWVAHLAPDDGTVFGRRTLPRETALCSVACAIQNLWLASRAENLGMGWVSLFDPDAVAALLALPPGSLPVGLLCIGPVDSFYPRPMLEQVGWRQRRPIQDFFCEDIAP